MKKLLILAVAMLVGTVFTISQSARADDLLTVGSKAPSIDIEYWLSNGNGKFEPIKEFEPGKVYVLEFWATWCGPCIASMPHIAELQEKYLDKGVQIISVSDEDKETVLEFLEKPVPGEDKTFAELTSAYCLTTDPDGSTHKDFFEAAGQNGIPAAFIIGKDQKIEWIGHPMEMEEVLDQVLEGKWDREAFAEKIRVEQEVNREMQKVMMAFQKGDMDEGLKILEELLEKVPDGETKTQLQMVRFSVLMQTGDDRMTDAFRDLTESAKSDPDMLNMISWGIVELNEAGQKPSKDLIDAARKAADLAVAARPDDASILDTQAHLAYMQGNLDEAIEIQTKAAEKADPEIKEEIQAFLEKLKKEKESQSDDDK